ncbi:protein of unknown function [Ruminococcus sp. YE71]|uniref:DUF4830 domain-containing protein n=1 Tax=unclassified Ruminococcus TaxID=2608920 RepID=UPI0008859BBF|nr:MULTISPECIES: DUF4830 domain-containing protein [unclassified Ruminococcus]SDA12227.1 protein of unknown function [Ruminococcus sp. YE78]SFW16578.1 protein of unknown function [Ruminococcus sp. YE71]
MYIKTVKLKKPVLVVLILTVAAAVLLVGVLTALRLGKDKNVYRTSTEQQRQSLISELGWETSAEPSEHKTITIPEEFDEVYKSYNSLQKEQGFDLEDFKGQKAEVYTYPILNYPDRKDSMQLTLISVGGVLIGGDVCCTELDGFMQGLLPCE